MTARRKHIISIPHRQRGAIFLVTLVVLVLGVSSVLVGSLNSSALQTARAQQTATALAQAKEALIGYAVTYSDTHSGTVLGYLPCPDSDASNGEGSSKLMCGSRDVSAIGRLPWRTLNLPPLRDGSNECLWYAVSGTYKNNYKTELMNWDTRGLFNVSDGNGNTMSDVVAVIFAPGAQLSGQDRSTSASAPVCGGNYTVANYLDNDGTHDNSTVSGTANAVSSFFTDSTSSAVNDRFIYITRQDIWNAIRKRNDFMTTLQTMTQKAAECLAEYGKHNYYYYYGDKRLPWSGRLYNPSSDYKTDSNYDDEDGRLAGRLPYRVNTAAGDTQNLINSPYYQLYKDGGNCSGVTGWSSYYPWWSNWKDHLYYAVSSSFDPSSSNFYYDSEHHTFHTPHCGSCLQVNGTEYAAVVIFAGQALPGQSRATDAYHLATSNYLESSNLTSINNSSNNGSYSSGTTTSSFNDVLYCIDQNLVTTACP